MSDRIPFRCARCSRPWCRSPSINPAGSMRTNTTASVIMAYKEGTRVTLLTRNDRDRTASFKGIADALSELDDAIVLLDGEVVASSVALPNVAFRRPPTAGPVLPESSSVAWPMNLASGMIAMAARKNTAVEGRPSLDHAIVIGVKTKRRRKNVCIEGRFLFHFQRSLSQHRALLPNGS